MRSVSLLALAALALASPAPADELKSGPDKKIGGSFQVTAYSGDNKGKTLCYV